MTGKNEAVQDREKEKGQGPEGKKRITALAINQDKQ